MDDWGVQSPPQHIIEVPLPFSEGDWIPGGYFIEREREREYISSDVNVIEISFFRKMLLIYEDGNIALKNIS